MWQEEDVPQPRGKGGKFIPYGQKLQNVNSRTIEGEGWALLR